MKTPPTKLIATSLLILVAVFASKGTAFASSSPRERGSVQYTRQDESRSANTCGARYKAKKGDTIASIAIHCGVSQGEVRAANGGRTKVKAGKVLRFQADPTPEPPRVVLPRVQAPPAPPTQAPPIQTRDEVFPTPAP